jgi:hypothetical protein
MCVQFKIITPENFLERYTGRSEMFVLRMGVNQSRVLHNFLITIICRLFQLADVPQPVYSYTFYPDPFFLRAVIITAIYGHDDRISIPKVRETKFSHHHFETD